MEELSDAGSTPAASTTKIGKRIIALADFI